MESAHVEEKNIFFQQVLAVQTCNLNVKVAFDNTWLENLMGGGDRNHSGNFHHLVIDAKLIEGRAWRKVSFDCLAKDI